MWFRVVTKLEIKIREKLRNFAKLFGKLKFLTLKKFNNMHTSYNTQFWNINLTIKDASSNINLVIVIYIDIHVKLISQQNI